MFPLDKAAATLCDESRREMGQKVPDHPVWQMTLISDQSAQNTVFSTLLFSNTFI